MKHPSMTARSSSGPLVRACVERANGFAYGAPDVPWRCILDLAVIDYAVTVPGRRLFATFIPEAWINDNAVEIDGRRQIDVTDAYLALDVADRANVESRSSAGDDLITDAHRAGHSGPFSVEFAESALEAFHVPLGDSVVEYTLVIDNDNFVRAYVGPNGSASVESTFHDEEARVDAEISTKEAISAFIFDYEYPHGEERPSEDTCNDLGEKIRDALVVDPYEVGVDTLETFILGLAAEGVDLNDPRFGRALELAVGSLAEGYT